MKKLLALALIAGSSVTLSSCGFTPVYGNLDAENQGSIQIAPIEGRSGHVLRQELVLLLRPGIEGVEAGQLEIEVSESISSIALARDGRNTRSIARASADYLLTTEKGQLVGTVFAEESFAASSAPYADVTARRGALDTASRKVSQKLVTDLIIQASQEDAFQQGIESLDEIEKDEGLLNNSINVTGSSVDELK